MGFAGTTESRIDGIMELWNYGIMELRKGQVGSWLMAHCSLLTAQSHSLLSLTSIPFRLLSLVFQQRSVSEAGQQVYKTTRLLVGAVVGGIRRNYGTTESRIDGIMELWIGRVGS